MAFQARSVLVLGGDLAGAAAALAAVRSGARTRLVVSQAVPPGDCLPIPEDLAGACETAVSRSDVPSPDEPQVFRFRARRVRRWLDELSLPNDAQWAALLHQAMLERCEREGVGVDRTTAPVRLVQGSRGVSGAVLVDGTTSTVQEADTTILAGGGARFLFDYEAPGTPPVGLALAVRAGLSVLNLARVAWTPPTGPRFVAGLTGDGRGQVLPGLAACGEPLASPYHASPELALVEDVVRGLEAGGFGGPPAGKGSPELVPKVDDPLPDGFTEVKLERLRALLSTHAGPEAGPEALEHAYNEVLSLRGEFADYARARVGRDVQLLHLAGDLALAHVAARTGVPGP